MLWKRLALALASSIFVAAAIVSPATGGPKPVSFKLQIKPILMSNCYGCHNPNNSKGNLDLTTKAGILKGGSEGKLFKAGKGTESLLVKRLKGKGGAQMPMGEPALKSAQIKLVTKWINEGGKF